MHTMTNLPNKVSNANDFGWSNGCDWEQTLGKQGKTLIYRNGLISIGSLLAQHGRGDRERVREKKNVCSFFHLVSHWLHGNSIPKIGCHYFWPGLPNSPS
jgi:hypothetical protein